MTILAILLAALTAVLIPGGLYLATVPIAEPDSGEPKPRDARPVEGSTGGRAPLTQRMSTRNGQPFYAFPAPPGRDAGLI